MKRPVFIVNCIRMVKTNPKIRLANGPAHSRLYHSIFTIFKHIRIDLYRLCPAKTKQYQTDKPNWINVIDWINDNLPLSFCAVSPKLYATNYVKFMKGKSNKYSWYIYIQFVINLVTCVYLHPTYLTV